MVFNSIASRTLPALATACLLGIALPATPALAQKTKTSPPVPAALEIKHSVSIPSIDAVDSSLSGEALTAILSGAIAEYADELAALDATSISVPGIQVTVSSTRGETSYHSIVTFTDLVLSDVADGIARTVSVSGATMTSDEASYEFGAISMANFNIGQMLGFYGLVETGRTEIETIYTDFTSVGGSLTSDGIECDIGAISGGEIKARPLKTSFVDMMAMAQDLETNPGDIDPTILAKIVRMYADMLTAFETSEIIFEGMSCEGVNGRGRQTAFELASMTVGPMSPGIYPSVSVDGLTMSVENDGVITLDNLTVKPIDFSDVIAVLESLPDDVDAAWFNANARLLVPAMEGFSFAGFFMDMPGPNYDETVRIQAKIGSFDLTLASYFNGIPTDIDLVASNIQTTLPDSGNDAFEQIRALGLNEIDADFRLTAVWDEATSAIEIGEFSVSGVNLATVTLAGAIANATADLFDVDEDIALMAAMDLALRGLDMSIADDKLSDLVFAIAAADQGVNPTIMRPFYAELAKGTVIGFLPGVADADKFADAISAFIRGDAKTLEIRIAAKNEPGLGIVDFLAAEDNPLTLIDKVNLTVVSK